MGAKASKKAQNTGEGSVDDVIQPASAKLEADKEVTIRLLGAKCFIGVTSLHERLCHGKFTPFTRDEDDVMGLKKKQLREPVCTAHMTATHSYGVTFTLN